MKRSSKEDIINHEGNDEKQLEVDYMKSLLERGIKCLYDCDHYLIEKNLSERSIAHMLALHLSVLLAGRNMHVDCEYNGDVDNQEHNRKRIWVLSEDLLAIKRNVPNEEEVQELSVYPDIIIHKRGNNSSNSLIIEIKKEYKGRQVGDAFDRLKLETYTSANIGNHLEYRLGAYIEFDTLTTVKSYRIDYYQGGHLIDKK